MDKLETAILKTLAYADIFDFPLKADEIWRFLIKETNNKQQITNNKIQKLIRERKIKKRNGFYFLMGREKVVKIRKKREKENRKKLQIVKKISRFLKIIPFFKMAAITGALAMENSKKEDDIDVLIVSKKARLWTTRFLVTILVEILAKRRRPGDKNITNKICLNMFLDEDHLTVPKDERDLFSAHEVIQLKPLWDRNETYQKFLVANQWVERFLPNAIKNKKQRTKNKEQKKLFFYLLSVICYLLSVENILKHFQLWYMRKRRTTEVISAGIIRFHPQDARSWVLKEYQKRVNFLNTS